MKQSKMKPQYDRSRIVHFARFPGLQALFKQAGLLDEAGHPTKAGRALEAESSQTNHGKRSPTPRAG